MVITATRLVQAAVDLRNIQFGNSRARLKQLGQIGLRTALVARDQLFHIETALARQLDDGLALSRHAPVNLVDPADSLEVRPTVAHPLGRALPDLTYELVQGFVQLTLRDGPLERDPSPIGFALALHRLDGLDGRSIDETQALDLDLARGALVDRALERLQIERTPPGGFDLQHEGPTAAQHEGVYIFSSRAVERVPLSPGGFHNGRGDQFLDALRILLARAVARGAAAASAVATGPLRLRDAPHQFAIASVDVQGPNPYIELSPSEVDEHGGLRMREVHGSPSALGGQSLFEALARFAIEFLFDGLRLIAWDAVALPERPFGLFDLRRNTRAHEICAELVFLQTFRDPLGPLIHAVKNTATDRARFGLHDRHGAILKHGEHDPERPPALGIRQTRAEAGEAPPQAAIADLFPGDDLPSPLEEFLHIQACPPISTSENSVGRAWPERKEPSCRGLREASVDLRRRASCGA